MILTRGVGLLVPPGGHYVLLARVNCSDLGPEPGQGLGDDARPAAHVQDPGHEVIMRHGDRYHLVPVRGLSVSASSGCVTPVSIMPSLTRGTLANGEWCQYIGAGDNQPESVHGVQRLADAIRIPPIRGHLFEFLHL